MVDTIKLEIPIADPMSLNTAPFRPMSVAQLVRSVGASNYTTLNPPRNSANYMPRLTLYRRPNKGMGVSYYLYVEFSAPKLLFGNNFDELKESDFPAVLTALQKSLLALLGVQFPADVLAGADVSAWHVSKNIVFSGYTQTQTVIDTIAKLDVNKRMDWASKDWRAGHIIHFHTNSRDIAFYDKVADLRQAKISPKRAFEQDSTVQLKLLGKLNKQRSLQVLRYEIRHVNRAAVKRAYPKLNNWTFEALFKEDLSMAVLRGHWGMFAGSLDMLALDTDKPHELLQNYMEANKGATPRSVLAAVTGLLINSQVGVRSLQNTMEKRYGKAWYRLKPLFIAPQKQRYTAFEQIDGALVEYKPVRLSERLKRASSK